eukprot:scaffold31947_cov63-Phaeocystis_antarctica.AAC.3
MPLPDRHEESSTSLYRAPTGSESTGGRRKGSRGRHRGRRDRWRGTPAVTWRSKARCASQAKVEAGRSCAA